MAILNKGREENYQIPLTSNDNLLQGWGNDDIDRKPRNFHKSYRTNNGRENE